MERLLRILGIQGIQKEKKEIEEIIIEGFYSRGEIGEVRVKFSLPISSLSRETKDLYGLVANDLAGYLAHVFARGEAIYSIGGDALRNHIQRAHREIDELPV